MSKSVKFLKIISPIALAITLTACGGGSGADFGSNGGGDSGVGTGVTTETEAETGTGVAEELVYTLQPLEVGISSLSAGGSTGITTRLIDQNGDLAAIDQTISFASPCISNGTSEIVSPITSNNGVFTSTYTAIGCEGDDVLTASVDGLSVESTLNVQAATLGAVEFISAEPQNILLKGMSAAGLQHTSTVRFQIKNNAGGPIANADVNFELTTDVGGIELASAVGKTDNQGFVSTILEAGTINTPVRVRATVTRAGTSISSESSQLSISTGVADQNSLSIALTNPTPSAWNHDGEEVGVTVFASDRFNNPVPDGTTVTFNTELGQIQPNCQTVNGRCVVNWTSAEARSLGIGDSIYTYNDDGVTTITATVIGEESFVDTNSNGIFDNGDLFDTNSDKGESFEDYNDDGIYNVGYEKFLDFNGNSIRDAKDAKYTGLGCQDTGGRCSEANGLKNIFVSTRLIMAEDSQNIRVLDASGNSVSTIIDGQTYTIEVSGSRNGQAPPSGTTLSVSSEEAEILTESTITVPVTRSRYSFTLRVRDIDVDEEVAGALITIKATTPKGLINIRTFNYQDIQP